MHDHLGHHRVVVGRNAAALHQSVVNAHAVLQRGLGLPPQHAPGLGRKAGVGVFGIQAGFDGVALAGDLRLRGRQGFARSHAQLPRDQVQPGKHLGNRMLHLQARIHFQKIVV